MPQSHVLQACAALCTRRSPCYIDGLGGKAAADDRRHAPLHLVLFFGPDTIASVCSALEASLQVALHVTKRPHGATASNRPTVSVGNSTKNVSREALRDAVSLRCLGSLSTPGSVGTASNKRAGPPRCGEASARTMPRLCVLRRTAHVVGVVVAAVSLYATAIHQAREVELRRIRISVEADWGGSALEASLQVALHVTKRQHGA
jgi:hypothetical protein